MGGPPGFGGPGGPVPFGDFRAPPPPWLHALKLTEEQQDKVFGIMHSVEPAMRDAAKAARKAHDALHDVGSSPQYDEGALTSLAQAQAKADTQMLLLRVKTGHAIYMVLTPEQRTQLADMHKDHEPLDHDRPR